MSMVGLARQANGGLAVEGVALDAIAREFGTPTYVYAAAHLSERFAAYRDAFAARDPLICYAVKANSNLSILLHFARLGAGFDIVSGGELARVLAVGAPACRVVFSGVGKSTDEMRAALVAGIHCFNVESESELLKLDRVARELGKQAPVSLRVNPDVDARTHPYISTGLRDNKFGIPFEQAPRLYRLAASLTGLRVIGVDCHIGSQLTEIAPFIDALDRLLVLVDALAGDGIVLEHLDLGGGLGVRYADEAVPPVADYAAAILARLGDRPQRLVLEPGRSLVGNAGLLLTRVETIKDNGDKRFVVVDAAMNDLMRPALYDAWHAIEPVSPCSEPVQSVEVVGPVCESGDFLARDRQLAVREGDLLAILSAGAYGMSMSSNYNTRPRAAEVMVEGGAARLIRPRETVDALIAGERALLQS
jgi:diaminopimelate decarboxylase